MIRRHLSEAEKHVAQGTKHVERQQELVLELERDGHDAKQAKQLLHQFQELLSLHIADRDRLVLEIASWE